LLRYNELTGAVSETDPLTQFHGFKAESGHQYWIDPATGASVWEAPAAYAWKEEVSKEHDGHSFFHNTARRRAGLPGIC